MHAAYNGHTEGVKFLLDKGASIDVKTPLVSGISFLPVLSGAFAIASETIDTGRSFCVRLCTTLLIIVSTVSTGLSFFLCVVQFN